MHFSIMESRQRAAKIKTGDVSAHFTHFLEFVRNIMLHLMTSAAQEVNVQPYSVYSRPTACSRFFYSSTSSCCFCVYLKKTVYFDLMRIITIWLLKQHSLMMKDECEQRHWCMSVISSSTSWENLKEPCATPTSLRLVNVIRAAIAFPNKT